MEEFFLKKVALKSEVRKMVGSAVFQADFIRVGWDADGEFEPNEPYMLEYGSGRVYGRLRAGVPGVIQVRVGVRRVPLFLDGYNAEKQALDNNCFIPDDLLLYRSAPMVVNLGELGKAEGRLVLRVEKHAEGYLFLPMDIEPLEPEAATVEMLAAKADRSELSNVMSEDVEGDVESVEPNLLTDALRKTEQALTDEEKAQVLVNLGRPEMKVFNDMWDAAWGAYGKYDPDNAPDPEHPYMGNDLWMTYEEAVEIMDSSIPYTDSFVNLYFHSYPKGRTLVPTHCGGTYKSMENAYGYCGIEAIALVSGYGMIEMATNISQTFSYCKNLREILGVLDIDKCTTEASVKSAFRQCRALEQVCLKGLKVSIDISDSPLLSLDSISYMIANAANTSPITITLHPDAYARVTDEIFAAAAEKQINIASI